MGKKLISTLLDKFKEEHSLYNEVRFEGQGGVPELLHPIFTFSQYIIDEFISLGEDRIVIVLPDNETSIVPMVAMHCFDCILNKEGYAKDLAETLQQGDHLRIKNAIVEFIGIDKKENKIMFYADNPRSAKIGRSKKEVDLTSKIGLALLNAEKTEGEITSFDRWNVVHQEILESEERNSIIDVIKSKRTLLNQTILIMTQKGDLRDLFKDIKVGDVALEDILSFGRINLRKQQKFELYNNGRLTGIPAITVASDMEDVARACKNIFKDKIECIFIAPDKANEVAEDDYNIRKCLKESIPMVVFLRENNINNYMPLKGYGFKIWHWKPATMKSEAFMTDSVTKREVLFGTLSGKINCATLAEIKTEILADRELRECGQKLYDVSKTCKEYASAVRRVIGKLWKIYKDVERLSYFNEEIKSELLKAVDAVEAEWKEISEMYEGQMLISQIERIVSVERSFISEGVNRKQESLAEKLKKINNKAVVIVPDGQRHLSEIRQFVARESNGKATACVLSEFESKQAENFDMYEVVFVPWFDSARYTEIKQLYCYETLQFILYAFEEKRRLRLIRERDDIVPYDQVKDAADNLNIIDSDYSERSIDDMLMGDALTEDFDAADEGSPIERYDFRSMVRRNIFAEGGSSRGQRNSSELVECRLIFFENDRYGYFYPTHKVFDVTKIVEGSENIAYDTKVKNLKAGSVIAESSGDKDIIRELADNMMKIEGKEGKRDIAAKWLDVLEEVAEGHSIKEIVEILNNNGADCSEQQCRVWLAGETIMPRDIAVLYAIGKAAKEISGKEEEADKFLDEIENIYKCGSYIHGVHQKAGRELKCKLAQKAEEIRDCVTNGMSGTIDGIGEIRLYRVEEVDCEKHETERSRLNKIEEE